MCQWPEFLECYVWVCRQVQIEDVVQAEARMIQARQITWLYGIRLYLNILDIQKRCHNLLWSIVYLSSIRKCLAKLKYAKNKRNIDSKYHEIKLWVKESVVVHKKLACGFKLFYFFKHELINWRVFCLLLFYSSN